MKREIIQTSDGSSTIHIPEWNESYHSKHGAIQEAKHVFIKNGFDLFPQETINILEIGFGTGLNTFITLLEAEKRNKKIDYHGVEAYPVSSTEIACLNYVTELDAEEKKSIFTFIHDCEWNKTQAITPYFSLTKRKHFFNEINDHEKFDLIYFDAFGYRVQPELWSEEIFKKMFTALKPNGILVTYAARGIIKKNMKQVGFIVEKLEGPPGKREMFRAIKKA